jgi:membrane protein implicated in regulation of membrane protease activity
MNRQLGIVAIVIGAAALAMGVLVLLVPTPSVGLGIGFLVVGVLSTVVGIRAATTRRSAGGERPGAPPETRPRSKFRQVLDGLSFFG